MGKNKQVATMLGLRVVAAIAVALVSIGSSNYMIVEAQFEESVDVSEDARVFSTYR